MDIGILYKHLFDDETVQLVAELVQRTRENHGKDIFQDALIDGHWAIIDRKLDQLETLLTPEVFKKRDLQHIIGAAIAHLSHICTEDNFKKGSHEFLGRICEMYSRNAHPKEYNFNSWGKLLLQASI